MKMLQFKNKLKKMVCHSEMGITAFKATVLYCFRELASLGIMLLGIFFGGLSGLALLHGFAATGRTRFNCCGGYKRRLLGRCCIGFVSVMLLISNPRGHPYKTDRDTLEKFVRNP